MSSPPSKADSYSSPHLTILLIIILIVFFLLTAFFVCLCKCFMESLFTNWRLQSSPTVNVVVVNPSPGLDPSVVQSFPTFVYANVKDLRQEKYGLECAICLLEFEDESVLRLLTFCYHVFHQECIDLWLESHKTCPVCRQDLTLPPEKMLERSPVIARDRDNVSAMPSIRESSNESLEDAVSIDIRDGEEERGDEGRTQSAERAINIRGLEEVERFPRSHSTGHSIARNNGASVDKYTLRFPDHVKVKITRGHTGSCITFGEITACNERTRTGGFGEVSGSSK
ncbi:RING-H2 finger protein ATL29-like [Punica granatum]|uniref:RING-type E3 ubiquitin transferase n=1 Tax=Punica granatum TaxID=22663 RepID=A0A218W4G1_PUNGR|nr:RING-H2 finger protein ATL29-like [Punica granatum]OWM67433.1 hypothetical protein CDL15_Pgr019893 [Punica granatum]